MTDDPRRPAAPVPPEVAAAAALFKLASHPLRLLTLLGLVGVEREFRDIEEALAPHLDALYRGGLVARRPGGRRNVYLLSPAGRAVVAAYRDLHEFAYPAGPIQPDSTLPVESVATTAGPPAAPASADRRLSAAALLRHAANPTRLRILLLLASGERDTAEIGADLGVARSTMISQQVAVLQDGALLAARRSGRQTVCSLTDAGLSLVQAVRATCSGLAIRRGELVLRPEPILGGGEEALDPTTPDGLALLFRAFADPTRLRLLNLLAGSRGVCLCHLEEVLGMPRTTILNGLRPPIRAGLVIASEEGTWPHYRLARVATDLHQGLLGCFAGRLADSEAFGADRVHLKEAAPCPAPPRDADVLPGTAIPSRDAS